MTELHEHLILNYLQGTLTPEEHQAFKTWLTESEEHRKTVESFQQVWLLSESKRGEADFQQAEEWTRLQRSIDQKARRTVLFIPNSYWLRIAASIIFFAVTSIALYQIVFRRTETVHETSLQTQHLTLPDGSKVWLNENSRIEYANDFNEVRTLSLEGEAFFDVRHDTKKPFLVKTGQTEISVLGTSFNIKSYEDEGQTEVFVVTGKVKFSTTNQQSNLVLHPGWNGVFNKKEGTLISKTEEQLNILAWKDKRLVFKKTPLREVIKTLQKYFKVTIQVKNEQLLNCRFSSSFIEPNLEEVMETLRIALDLQVDNRQNGYAIDGVGCNTD